MDPHEQKGPTFEELAVERDRALDRAAAEGAKPSEFMYTPTPPDYGVMVFRDSAAIPMPCDASFADRGMVERLLLKVRHVLYALDEQQQEIARLRENTRHVLARLSAA